MDLRSYLDAAEIKQTDFAAAVGVTDGTISRLLGKQFRPGLDLALAIEKATNGKVPMSEWARERKGGDDAESAEAA